MMGFRKIDGLFYVYILLFSLFSCDKTVAQVNLGLLDLRLILLHQRFITQYICHILIVI